MTTITEITKDTVLKNGDILSEDLARDICREDYDDTVIEVVFEKTYKEDAYKDQAPAELVFKHNDKFWRFWWQAYTSHYGSGESSWYDCELQEVRYFKREVVTIEEGYEAVK